MNAPVRYTFPAKEKLKSRKVIEAIFQTGKSFSHFPFRVFYIWEEASGQPVQVGVGATKRSFKRAVDRNRIKRLLREAYRLRKHELNAPPEGKGFRVFILYTGRELPELPLVMEKMGGLIKKLNALEAPAEAEGPQKNASAEGGNPTITEDANPSL